MAEKSASGPQLLICIINGKDFLDWLLEAFLELGISGATVVQSQGMGRILVRDFPLFAGFKELLESGGPFNYTVLSVVYDPKLIDDVIELLPDLRKGDDSKGALHDATKRHSIG